MGEKIKCDVCPRCNDVDPGKVDKYGYHFCICGMGGNIVYTVPHREKKVSGHGWIDFPVSGCGLYDTVEDALADMTDVERRRWAERRAADDRADAENAPDAVS